MSNSKPKSGFGWRSRGYLPHFDDGRRTQTITARLFDSMPKVVLDRWLAELNAGEITDVDLKIRIEEYLDRGHGSCFLKDERVAAMVCETFRKHDGVKYDLKSYVVMPNHLHFMYRPIPPFKLDEIVHSIKSYTAHEANRILGRRGRFWFPEPFDRYIRDADHFAAAKNYIEMNPVNAGLCATPDDWKWSSAYRGP